MLDQATGGTLDADTDSPAMAPGDSVTLIVSHDRATGIGNLSVTDNTANTTFTDTYTDPAATYQQARVGVEFGIDPFHTAPYSAPSDPVRLVKFSGIRVTDYSGQRAGFSSPHWDRGKVSWTQLAGNVDADGVDQQAAGRDRSRIVGPMKMHDGEVDIDASLVRRLVAAQFPDLAGLAIAALESTGTVNAIYRLGEQLCIRLPRIPSWADSLEREWRWLPKLATQVSLQVPEPVAKGRPANWYPLPWAIYRWIDGQPYAGDLIADEPQAARDLAHFVTELRQADPAGAPRGGRRPLHDLDAATRAAISSAQEVIDAAEAAAAWELALQAPPWHGVPVWVHTDLLRPNLLVSGGRLHAVIDFGGAGAGDPAADVIPAWSVFGPAGRAAYRAALGVDDGTWLRARGYALHQAAMIIPYYPETNPGFVAQAKRTVEQVLTDIRG